jgi:hypothetical protein
MYIRFLAKNQKFYYLVHKSSPLVGILSEKNDKTLPYRISLRPILILFLNSASDLFPSGFSTKHLEEFFFPL